MEHISIIVPVYRTEGRLEGCIRSILAQRHSDFELLLVDDGSPDRSGEICDAWAAKDPRVVALHKENGGVSAARNYALDRAHGDFIACVDSDDYVSPEYLSGLLELYRKGQPGCIAACNHLVVRDGTEKRNYAGTEEAVWFNRREAYESVLLHRQIDVSAWGKLFPAELFRGKRFPEGQLYEDTWLFPELLDGAPGVMYGSEPLYFYVMTEGSIVNSAFSEAKLAFPAAADKLAAAAEGCDPALHAAAQRRRLHARLSTVRYMENCEEKFLPVREKYRSEILALAADAGDTLSYRDRFGVELLKAGWKTFYGGWELYGKIRRWLPNG